MFGVAIVGFDPLLHRLADVPRGIVPDEQEGTFAWTVKYVASHARKAQVTMLRGRPCTKRNSMWWAVGT